MNSEILKSLITKSGLKIEESSFDKLNNDLTEIFKLLQSLPEVTSYSFEIKNFCPVFADIENKKALKEEILMNAVLNKNVSEDFFVIG